MPRHQPRSRTRRSMHAGKMSHSPVVCTLSERHGSRSRAPSVVCSWASATKGAQHCPDDKASDILPACCKNWVNRIDSADSSVVGLQTLGQPRQTAPQLRLRCRPLRKSRSPGAPKHAQANAEAENQGTRRGQPVRGGRVEGRG